MRPAELAQDNTPHLPVIQHAVSWLAEHQSYRPDAVLILQPTSPLRSADDIAGALRLLESSGLRVVRCDFLFPELLPLAARRLRGDRRAPQTAGGDVAAATADFPSLPRWVDVVAYAVSRLSAAGRRVWPLGTSLLAIATPSVPS